MSSASTELIIIIRPSFKRFCGQDACRAALFNQFLFWIAWKAKNQSVERIKSSDVYWYGSAEEICQGLDNSWSVNKVRKEIKELVDAGLIGQRHNPYKGWDQTRHYFFGDEQGKVLREACEKHDVCLQHLGLIPDVLHLLNLVNAFDKNGKCNCQICEMDLPDMADASTKNGNAIPKVSTKVSSKATNKGNFASDDATHTFSQEEIHEKAIEFIKQKGVITFSDLEDFLGQYIDVEGTEQIANDKYKNAVAWHGISNECCKVMIPILMDKRTKTQPCSESLYERKLKFPVATKREDHEKYQWHPEIISYKGEE